jgi:hypothetical protein
MQNTVILATPILLTEEQKVAWQTKILTELVLDQKTIIDFLVKPELILGYSLTINATVYNHSFHYLISQKINTIQAYV